METCFNYCEPNKGFFSSDERRWITRIYKLKEKYPDQIRIIAEPKTNNGCIYCELPAKWMRISPPRKLDISEEQRKAFSERMTGLRNKQQGMLQNEY